jgi:3-polyprenyl-4-hydroxybenzoate decarboxylase
MWRENGRNANRSSALGKWRQRCLNALSLIRPTLCYTQILYGFARSSLLIRELESRKLLKRIAHPVSARLEITEIADRVIKRAGPALLFENVRETPRVPVAIGLYGSHERMALALHDSPQNIAARIQGLIQTVPRNAAWQGANRSQVAAHCTQFEYSKR